jgi:PEP-CTERM motif
MTLTITTQYLVIQSISPAKLVADATATKRPGEHLYKPAQNIGDLNMSKTWIKPLAASLLATLAVSTTAFADTIIFSDNFNNYTGNQYGNQPGTGLALSYSGSLPLWNSSGLHAVHAVNFGADYAATLYGNNVLTLKTAVAANVAGQQYQVSFDTGPSVYLALYQGSNSTDGINVGVLRNNNSVLSSYNALAGAWSTGPNAQDLHHVSFSYVGDGSGDVVFRLGTINPGADRFGGAVDNFTVSTAAVPEPSTYAMFGLGLALLVGMQRRRAGQAKRA